MNNKGGNRKLESFVLYSYCTQNPTKTLKNIFPKLTYVLLAENTWDY